MSVTPNLPGRLGTPDMQLRDDPRADPRMVAAMAPFALDQMPPPVPVDSSSPVDAIHEHVVTAEAGFGELFAFFFDGLDELPVERTTQIIQGVDGNDITLFIHRPADHDGPLPGIVHTHGGGMVLGAAADPNYVRWRDELAAAASWWSASSSATGRASSATTRSRPVSTTVRPASSGLTNIANRSASASWSSRARAVVATWRSRPR